MRKKEYTQVYFDHFHSLPAVSPVFYFSEVVNRLETAPIEIVQADMLTQLQNRRKVSIDTILTVPYELRAAVYFGNLSTRVDDLLKLYNEEAD